MNGFRLPLWLCCLTSLTIIVFSASELTADVESPVRLECNLSHPPLLNEEAVLTTKVFSTINVTGLELKLSLPAGANLLQGQEEWQCDLEENEEKIFKHVIIFTDPGNKYLEISAYRKMNDHFSVGDIEHIYLNIDKSRSKFGYEHKQDYHINIADEIPVRVIEKTMKTLPDSLDGPGGETPTATFFAGGEFRYYDQSNTIRPLKYYIVRLMDEDVNSSDDILRYVMTDETGQWNMGPIDITDTDEGGAVDIYAEAELITSCGTVANYSNYTYKWKSSVFYNAQEATYIFDMLIPDGDTYEGAAWIYDYMVTAWESAPTDPGDCRILWDPDGTSGPYFSTYDERIVLKGSDKYYQDVIFHEIGHNYMWNLYNEWWPENTYCPSPHYIQLNSHVICAWTEGWANYFSLYVPNDPVYSYEGWSVDFESPTWDTPGFDDGEACEGRVAGALWDIYDNADDGYDDTGFGIDEIWTILSNGTQNTFAEFWSDWQARGYNEHYPVASIYQNTIDYNDAPVISGIPDVSLCSDGTDQIDLWAYTQDDHSSDSELSFGISGNSDPNVILDLVSDRYLNISTSPGWSGTSTVTIEVDDLIDDDIDPFTVSVGPAPSGTMTNFVASTNRCDGIYMTWNWNGINTSGFRIYRNSSLVNTTFTPDETSFLDGNCPSGTYDYEIYAYNGCGSVLVGTATGTRLTTLSSPPPSFTASNDRTDGIMLTWSWTQSGHEGFKIWRDGELVHSSNDEEERTWLDETCGGGNNGYELAAYNSCSESNHALITGTRISKSYYVTSYGSDMFGDGTLGSPFATIQHAIDLSASGDSVIVHPGTYNENIDYLGKDILVESLFNILNDPNMIEYTIIDGGDSSSVVTFKDHESSSAILRGFKLINGAGFLALFEKTYGGGVYCSNGAEPTLDHLIIESNGAGYGGGVCARNAGFTLSNCKVLSNDADYHGGGCAVWDGNITIENCVFFGNTTGAQGGVVYQSYGSLNINSCTLVNNSPSVTVWIESGVHLYVEESIIVNGAPYEIYGACTGYTDTADITCSLLEDGQSGVYLCNGTVNYSDNIEGDPLFCNIFQGNLTLSADSPCLAENNQYCGLVGALGLGCSHSYDPYDRVVHVEPDGSGEAVTIQEGINIAFPGDTILLHNGIFSGDGNRDIDFLGKTITVKSVSGPDSSIIDCGGTATEFHRGFYFHNDEDSSAVLSGIKVINGRLQSDYPDPCDNDGSGIFCYGASPKIVDCVISDNSDGGILCIRSSAVIRGNIIESNNGPGIKADSSALLVEWNTFDGNTCYGIYVENDTSSLISNTVYGNNKYQIVVGVYGGGGIKCVGSATTIISNTSAGWVAGDGGVICIDGNYIIEGNHFCGSTTFNPGAGIQCYGSTAIISNNEISDNCLLTYPGAFHGGGIYLSTGTYTVTENIIENNKAQNGAGLYAYDITSESSISNNQIKGNLACEHHVFEGYGGGLYIRACSPGIHGNIISHNAASQGGGIYCEGASPTIANNTLFNNFAAPCLASNRVMGSLDPEDIFGGGILCASGSCPIIQNCILACNSSSNPSSGGGIYVFDTSSIPSIGCSDIFNNAGGDYGGFLDSQNGINGNVSCDPMFCDAENELFTLQDYSPCLPDYNSCGLIGAFTLGCASTDTAWVDMTTIEIADGEKQSFGMSWTDFDNDGYEELYCSGVGANTLFDNVEGELVLSAIITANDTSTGRAAVWGDYNNNHFPDLFVANIGNNILYENSGGTELVEKYFSPFAATDGTFGANWVDVDNDGDLDLYCVNGDAQPNKLLKNVDGELQWTFSGNALDYIGNSIAAAWGDYDNDGDQDVYISNHAEANLLLKNDGTGIFTDATNSLLGDSGLGKGALWADFNNDGYLDLYIIKMDGENLLLTNEGYGDLFNASTLPSQDAYLASYSADAGDYDNDGDLDLYITVDGPNVLLRNDGTGQFVEVTGGVLANPLMSRATAWCDYDNDGALDLYFVNWNAGNCLIKNNLGNGNHWLKVRLKGKVSNYFGIGARLRLVADGVQQIREITAGRGYLSQGPMLAHFGLGTATSVDSLIIEWPSGVRDVYLSSDLPIDHTIEGIEGARVGIDHDLPSVTRLHTCYPNPFNPSTKIEYEVGEGDSRVKILIFDVSGRLVKTLIDQEVPRGRYLVTWDGKNDSGEAVTSGVYFAVLKTASITRTSKMVLLR